MHLAGCGYPKLHVGTASPVGLVSDRPDVSPDDESSSGLTSAPCTVPSPGTLATIACAGQRNSRLQGVEEDIPGFGMTQKLCWRFHMCPPEQLGDLQTPARSDRVSP